MIRAKGLESVEQDDGRPRCDGRRGQGHSIDPHLERRRRAPAAGATSRDFNRIVPRRRRGWYHELQSKWLRHGRRRDANGEFQRRRGPRGCDGRHRRDTVTQGGRAGFTGDGPERTRCSRLCEEGTLQASTQKYDSTSSENALHGFPSVSEKARNLRGARSCAKPPDYPAFPSRLGAR